jgi:threonylcarbamoyladenosine tRNA methylthiotransferase MtaB
MNKKKVAFYTLGCKLNFAETSTLSQYFENAGYEIVNFSNDADIYVINSCSVTSNANKKSRNAISRAKNKNQNAIVVLTGCFAQLQSENLKENHAIDYIIGANDKDKIIDLINRLEKNNTTEIITTDHKDMKRFFPSVSYGDRTRSFFKIQDGCDYFCAYCTIPYARGRSRNQSIEQTVSQARDIAKKGIKEIILTGINIGDFGKSTGENFYELLVELIKVEGIERIRLGSIEPNLLTTQIIELVATNKKLLPHFHIPLQTGSDILLKLIRRKYDTNLFRKKIETIKTLIPDAFIGIDLIVGLNGETNEMLEETKSFIQSLDISYIHHFQYSEREGTPAVNFLPKTNPHLKQERANIINEICETKHKTFLNSQVGSIHEVLFETSVKKNKVFGYTENYIKVSTDYDEQIINKILKIKITGFIDNETMNCIIL